MKIKHLQVYKKDLGNKRPYTIAFKTVDEVNNAFVEIHLENGMVGMGAGNPSEYVVGESLAQTLAALNDGALDFMVGRDIRDFYGILDDIQNRLPKNPAARAALDIAMHDAFSQWLGVPLAHFLGQKIETLPTSVTIGIKNVADTLHEAQEYHDMGFRVLKVKTGKSVEEDVERIKRLREAYGDTMTIRVDANQGYSVEGLARFHEATAQDAVELIEQPLPAKSVEAMKGLPLPVKEVIAADESLISPADAFALAAPPAASGIFNIKLMKSGGVGPARQIADIAKAANTDLMWGCNDESAVSISAALHTALAYPNTKYLDLDGSLDLAEDVVTGGFTIENGWMRVTNKPGLGLSRQ